jgi:uncharacterized protein with HEPN domain
MRPESRKFLFDIQTAAKQLDEFTQGKSFTGYSADPMLRSAVERQFEIIGEALAQLAKIDQEAANRISDWRRIVDFRNVLAHGYAVVDDRLVWDILQSKLPTLEREVSALLDR